jgi:uncharacterized membrane protein YcaP (DUF421 family)
LVVLFVLVRVTGKRELAEMSAFEMLLLILLGDVTTSDPERTVRRQRA